MSIFAPGILNGQTALITGGGSGIGAGIARRLAAAGATVGLLGRTPEKLEAVAAEIRAAGGSAFCAPADVRDYAKVAAAMDTVQQQTGRLDILVCSAAGNFLAPAVAMSANAFRTVIDIDLCGTFNVCRAAFPLLSAAGGCILNITALQARLAMPFQAHAGAAKAGIEKLTQDLALEWGPAGIRVNALCPGATDGTEGLIRLAPEGYVERYIGRLPLRRLGNIPELGEAALFLCSPAAAYITGTTLTVDGGGALIGMVMD